MATDSAIALLTVQDDAANQMQFVGGGQSDRLGLVFTVDDVNGGGVSDLVIGAPFHDTNSNRGIPVRCV